MWISHIGDIKATSEFAVRLALTRVKSYLYTMSDTAACKSPPLYARGTVISCEKEKGAHPIRKRFSAESLRTEVGS